MFALSRSVRARVGPCRDAVKVVAILGALCALARPAALFAQSSTIDVIRGRVTDDSARVLSDAPVTITRGPDRLIKQTKTDSAGRYSLTFENGTGDYLVFVTSPGYRSARRRVQRQGTERELVADFTLGRDLATLAAVKVKGERPVRARNDVYAGTPETGASEKWADGVNGQLPPTSAGDLNALAGTFPGVTLTPGGPSILGAGAESNLTTLNGMGLAAGAIPRAAHTETRVTGASFDPTRGGFAGANIDVRLGPGSRNYQERNGFLTLDAPQLQYTDAVGRALGAASGGFRGSLGADGELIRRALTYNVAVDVARSASNPQTLLAVDAATLLQAGVAPDSVARLLAVTGPLGLPLTGNGAPSSRQRDALTWLGRLDDTRDTLQTRTLTSYAGFTREGALGFGPLAAPSAGGEREERTLGVQAVHGIYVGPGRRVLTETHLAASQVKTNVTPYRALPGATVLVRSATLGAQSDVTGLSIGGSPFLASDDARWTVEGSNATTWNARGRRHRFKALLWGRGDGLRQETTVNRFGSYIFSSIADLAAGRPASYSRTLTEPVKTGTVWNAATALAHGWTQSRWFNVLYGLRVEGSGFADAPPRNAALEQALGVATGSAPSRLHLSPRAGFTYTYNRDKDNGNGMSSNGVGQFYRGTAGVIRGGIGDFRDLLRPNLLADASAGAGLAGSTEFLSCVGAAVPTPDWTSFVSDPGSIPTRCSDGSGVLSERAPSVTLIDPKYDVPHSWRASVDWNTSYHRWLVRVNGLASYDMNQPGTVDANFSGTPRFTLADEGGRPVYVTPASIDAASGAVSATESRRAAEFGRVGVRTSDLRGYGGQMTFGLSPDVFKFRSKHQLFVSAAYTLQAMRRQFRGFDGAGFGDPSVREWGAGPNDARHVLVLQGGFAAAKLGTITMFARTQSGLPFTPVVQGDVNGDGRFNDRAFIPPFTGQLSTEPDAALATQLRSLRDGGSGTVARCLAQFEGRVAARNGCRGPWTESLNLQWRPPIRAKWSRRLESTVYFQNPLGGLDQLLHGEKLHGWGSQATPDPSLFIPKGFDAGTKRFRYDVNPRFGNTRGARSLLREPFRVTIDFSLRLSTDYTLQQLRRALEPVKVDNRWMRRTADSLTAFYLSGTSNIHLSMLAESDSLFLTSSQIVALRRADSVYSAQIVAIYAPLGDYLSRIPGGVAGKAAMDTVEATSKAYWKIFWKQPEIADSVITPAQRELLPMLKSMLSIPEKTREHNRWMFGYPVKLRATKPKPATP